MFCQIVPQIRQAGSAEAFASYLPLTDNSTEFWVICSLWRRIKYHGSNEMIPFLWSEGSPLGPISASGQHNHDIIISGIMSSFWSNHEIPNHLLGRAAKILGRRSSTRTKYYVYLIEICHYYLRRFSDFVSSL
jgi:hypothetical protein